MAVLSLSSCVVPVPVGAKLYNCPKCDADRNPPSLAQWQKEHGTLHVLVVHGMNNHPFGNPAKLGTIAGCQSYAEVQEKLSHWDSLSEPERRAFSEPAVRAQSAEVLKDFAKACGQEVCDECDAASTFKPVMRNGKAVGYTFTRPCYSKDRRQETAFHVVSWALGAAVAKEKQYGNPLLKKPGGLVNDYDPEYAKRRYFLNGQLKQNMMNWGLTDAALYIGPHGADFQYCVTQGIKDLLSGLRDEDHVAVVSSSLGSTITFETFDLALSGREGTGSPVNLTSTERAKLKRLFSMNTATAAATPSPHEKGEARVVFYMFANQFGLLTVGRNAGQSEATSMDPTKQLCETISASRSREKAKIQLIAFSDPNDMLTYSMPESDTFAVTNVYVRNPNLKVSVFPLMKFNLSNPLTAHTAYGHNPEVVKIMRDGLAE